MSAWVKQIPSQVKKHGTRKASWYCFWNEPNGTRRKKSCGPGSDGKRRANLLADQVRSQLTLGTYEKEKKANKNWEEFRKELEQWNATHNSASDCQQLRYALDRFEEVCKPKVVADVTTQTIEKFTAERLKGGGVKKGSSIKPQTVNKDLRYIRKTLNRAHELGYVPATLKIKFLREAEEQKRCVLPEHFGLIYEACDAALNPVGPSYSAGDWWRAYLVFNYMTGWRRSEPLAMRWDDVDLKDGYAITRAANNKGKRTESVPLSAVVIEHLERIKSFDERVFPWDKDSRGLYVELERIQSAAGIHLPCIDDREHECTDSCHQYSFHDFRRGFATNNEATLSPKELQSLMRHKSRSTTDRYIVMARNLKRSADGLFVPDVLTKDAV